ncbi:hypothetical protein JYU34_015345 [Plutella xylostella]|uniref:Uncharacterized protein n=1 Tax=Plutella xylostella TaxID=51655 RepID=A0ABQ7QAN3_PLUXY|nr:hypothetical protein JYU34_015345 [Plutella xylostella]
MSREQTDAPLVCHPHPLFSAYLTRKRAAADISTDDAGSQRLASFSASLVEAGSSSPAEARRLPAGNKAEPSASHRARTPPTLAEL